MDRDELTTGRARVPSSGMLVALTVLGVVLFATGVGPRPDGAGWDRLYDVVLYNCAYLPAAVLCCYAARRLPRERLAWRALAVSLLLNATANALRTLTAGLDGNGTSPVLAVDVMSLIAYLTLYVTMVGLIRARVPRFHPSMWLDGLIGALGTTAVGVAFLIGPYLDPAAGHGAVPLVQLAMPATDVLLLALMVAVGSILGVRLDRTLFLVITAMGAIFVGDVILFARTVSGTYVDGSPLELTWLLGIVLVALAAHHARPRPAPAGPGRRPGRRDPARMAPARPPPRLQHRQPRRPRPRVGRPAAARRRLAGHRLRAGRGRPDRSHLPRGAGVQRGQATGAHRRTDRPGQPPGAARSRRAGARHGDRPASGRAAAARSRRLQGGQRQPRAHGR